MRCFIGIDLGSTTTKAVVIDEDQNILGRGITNSRSNYDTAAAIAKQEALVNARFYLFRQALSSTRRAERRARGFPRPARARLPPRAVPRAARPTSRRPASATPRARSFGDAPTAVGDALDRSVQRAARPRRRRCSRPAPSASRTSSATSPAASYLAIGETVAKECRHPLRHAAQRVRPLDHRGREPRLRRLDQAPPAAPRWSAPSSRCPRPPAARDAGRARRSRACSTPTLEETYVVGTGYGRARLPFPKEHIRSEILCHGLGAHVMYPGTATVLDIGGQDTKAIQVDPNGIVESFQMNDRCAAGCGRYLGYIADEMNMGLHELGPMAMKSTKTDPHQLDLHGVRRRRAARPAVARRQARGHHGRPAPRHHPARDVDPRALGRHPQRVHLHRRRRQERGGGARR